MPTPHPPDTRQMVRVRGIYHVNMWYQGKYRRRTTGTGHLPTAQGVLARMNTRRQQLAGGLIQLPDGVDPWDFIFDGIKEPPLQVSETATASAAVPDIEELVKRFGQTLGPPKISAVYAKTQRVYLSNFLRFLTKVVKLPKSVADWQTSHIEQYRLWRLGPKGRKRKGAKPVRAVSVGKEMQTLRGMFAYARRQGWIVVNPVCELEPIPDAAPDGTYRVTDEIHALERSGRLSADAARQLRRKWLLDVGEVEHLKRIVWDATFQCYMHRPGDMALGLHIAADAGFRLGEVARLTTLDVVLNVEAGTGILTARSRKQSRRVVETERHVPIRGELVRRLANWMAGLKGRSLFTEEPPEAFRARFYRALDRATENTPFAGIRPICCGTRYAPTSTRPASTRRPSTPSSATPRRKWATTTATSAPSGWRRPWKPIPKTRRKPPRGLTRSSLRTTRGGRTMNAKFPQSCRLDCWGRNSHDGLTVPPRLDAERTTLLWMI